MAVFDAPEICVVTIDDFVPRMSFDLAANGTDMPVPDMGSSVYWFGAMTMLAWLLAAVRIFIGRPCEDRRCILIWFLVRAAVTGLCFSCCGLKWPRLADESTVPCIFGSRVTGRLFDFYMKSAAWLLPSSSILTKGFAADLA